MLSRPDDFQASRHQRSGDTPHRRRPPLICRILASSMLVALACLGSFADVPAQEYGRWTWYALFGAKGRNLDNTQTGQAGSSYQDTQLDLDVGIHGYIFHPSIASFDLGASLLYNDIDGRSMSGGRNLGLNAALELTPLGAWPSRFFYARTDYSDEFSGFFSPTSGIPAGNTRYGASVRNRRGLLRGLSLGFLQNETDFLHGSAPRPETRLNAHLDWNRHLGPVTSSFRLENTRFESGPLDYSYDDWTARLNQSASLSEHWNWAFTGSMVQRDNLSSTQSNLESRNLRLSNQFLRRAADSTLSLRQAYYQFASHGFSFSRRQMDTQSLSASYLYSATPNLQIGPFASYSAERSDETRLDAPQGGLEVAWQPLRDRWTAGLSARTSVGSLRDESGGMSRKDNTVSYGASARLGHGKALGGLRKELDLDINYNDLVLIREPLPEFPDIILPGVGVGGTNTMRGRFTLRHAWDSRQVSGYGEWSRDRFEAAESHAASTSQRLSASFQFSHPAFTAGGQILDFRLVPSQGSRQEATAIFANARWRVRRSLSVRGNYRYDMRRLELAPDVDVSRYELGLEYRLGQFLITAGLYELHERPDDGSERTQRGITWSVGRRFAGPLPVMTGSRRRGTIR